MVQGIAKRLSDYCKNNNMKLTFIQLGKPAQKPKLIILTEALKGDFNMI
jgi:hypothetical protein